MVVLLISYLSGLLTFVVPAGFGILEAGLIYGLNSIFEINQIIMAVVIYRLGNIFSTLITWLVCRIYIKNVEKKSFKIK